jgi:hypothetical protein
VAVAVEGVDIAASLLCGRIPTSRRCFSAQAADQARRRGGQTGRVAPNWVRLVDVDAKPPVSACGDEASPWNRAGCRGRGWCGEEAFTALMSGRGLLSQRNGEGRALAEE